MVRRWNRVERDRKTQTGGVTSQVALPSRLEGREIGLVARLGLWRPPLIETGGGARRIDDNEGNVAQAGRMQY